MITTWIEGCPGGVGRLGPRSSQFSFWGVLMLYSFCPQDEGCGKGKFSLAHRCYAHACKQSDSFVTKDMWEDSKALVKGIDSKPGLKDKVYKLIRKETIPASSLCGWVGVRGREVQPQA